MPALAAVVNKAVPGDKTINLYYNTSSAQVALSLQSGTSDPDPDEYWAAADTDYPGYILNPSEIAAAQYRGVNLVVAATTPKESDKAPTVNNISIVSPIYQMLTTTTLANNKIAIASAGEAAWVYFLASATSKDGTYLKEHNLVTHANASYLQNMGVKFNSSLGAWYEPTKRQRLVIYQDARQNYLKEYNVTTDQSVNISTTDNAKLLTTLALTYFNGNVYLYYTNTSNNLIRVVKDASGWGSPKKVQGSANVAEKSQLTVTTSNGYNHIFYVSEENLASFAASTKFTHIWDEISE